MGLLLMAVSGASTYDGRMGTDVSELRFEDGQADQESGWQEGQCEHQQGEAPLLRMRLGMEPGHLGRP
jgi:hypothetical protein